MEHRWAVTTATGEFLYGHVEPGDVPQETLKLPEERVVLQRRPNPRTERYSGDPSDPIQAKTQAEISAWDAARKDGRVDALIDDLTFRVLAKWIAQLHGLTPAQARQQLKTIVRGMM